MLNKLAKRNEVTKILCDKFDLNSKYIEIVSDMKGLNLDQQSDINFMSGILSNNLKVEKLISDFNRKYPEPKNI